MNDNLIKQLVKTERKMWFVYGVVVGGVLTVIFNSIF